MWKFSVVLNKEVFTPQTSLLPGSVPNKLHVFVVAIDKTAKLNKDTENGCIYTVWVFQQMSH